MVKCFAFGFSLALDTTSEVTSQKNLCLSQHDRQERHVPDKFAPVVAGKIAMSQCYMAKDIHSEFERFFPVEPVYAVSHSKLVTLRDRQSIALNEGVRGGGANGNKRGYSAYAQSGQGHVRAGEAKYAPLEMGSKLKEIEGYLPEQLSA